MTRISFRKMHGLGNDFVIVDAREEAFAPSPAQAAAIADRKHGIGCDQLIILSPSSTADLSMRIVNADGSDAQACGICANLRTMVIEAWLVESWLIASWLIES